VDAAGIALLKEPRSRCVTLLSLSRLVAEQLKDVQSCGEVGEPDWLPGYSVYR